jgi:ribosomal protein S18 acetylase RimI-like enzyme
MPDDAEGLLVMWRQAEATASITDAAPDVRRALAESPACVLVAEVGGRLVGSVIGSFDGWRGNLYRMAVHPAYRRRGIGRALVAEVERQLTRQGARRITALVEKEHAGATGFWRAVGYAVDERIVRFVRTV